MPRPFDPAHLVAARRALRRGDAAAYAEAMNALRGHAAMDRVVSGLIERDRTAALFSGVSV